MTKTKSNFIVGAIILLISNLITKFIGAIYRVPLLKILGSEGLGQYQMILPIFALFLVIASSGVVVAMSKLISKESAHKNNKNAKKILISGIIISLVSSIILSTLLIFFSPFIAKYQNSSGLLVAYIAVVPAIVVGSLTSVFRGYFLGKKKMLYSGLTQVVEAVSKLVFSLVLSLKFLSRGQTMAVFGALVGISISEIISFAFAIVVYFVSKNKDTHAKFCGIVKNKQMFFQQICLKKEFVISKQFLKFHSTKRYLTFFGAFKKVLSFSFFVMLQACIMPLINAIDSVVVVPLLIKGGIIKNVAYSLYGIENGIVSSILVLPTVVSSAVGASIIPNIKNKGTNKSKQTILELQSKNSKDASLNVESKDIYTKIQNKRIETNLKNGDVSSKQISKTEDVTSKNIKNAFNIVWLSSIFCAFVFALFSNNITTFLYGSGLSGETLNELAISSDLLKINSFNIVYLCLLNISISVLQGLEKNKAPVINLASAGILRLFVLIVLISNEKLNIYGTALADMAFYSFALVLNLREIRKSVDIKFSFSKFAVLPPLCCVVMSLTMIVIKSLLGTLLTPRILTLLVLFCGGGVYLIMLVITKVLNFKEIANSFFKKKQNV